jgi:hypothetical protein
LCQNPKKEEFEEKKRRKDFPPNYNSLQKK